MSTLVSLQYPNGRTHDAEVPENLTAGARFELFGRHWEVVGNVPTRYGSRYAGRPTSNPRLLCRQER